MMMNAQQLTRMNAKNQPIKILRMREPTTIEIVSRGMVKDLLAIASIAAMAIAIVVWRFV